MTIKLSLSYGTVTVVPSAASLQLTSISTFHLILRHSVMANMTGFSRLPLESIAKQVLQPERLAHAATRLELDDERQAHATTYAELNEEK